jgi:periplasmic protein TonB
VNSSLEALIAFAAAVVFGCATQPPSPAPRTLTNEAPPPPRARTPSDVHDVSQPNTGFPGSSTKDACPEGGSVWEVREVRLSIDLGADGKVKQVEVVKSGGPDYDSAALEAVKRNVYSPATRGGVPVPYRFSHTYVFNLCRDP